MDTKDLKVVAVSVRKRTRSSTFPLVSKELQGTVTQQVQGRTGVNKG